MFQLFFHMPQLTFWQFLGNHHLIWVEKRSLCRICLTERSGNQSEVACLRAKCFDDFKTDCLTASMFSAVRAVWDHPLSFLITDLVSLKFFTHNITDFRTGTVWREGILKRYTCLGKHVKYTWIRIEPTHVQQTCGQSQSNHGIGTWAWLRRCVSVIWSARYPLSKEKERKKEVRKMV